MAHMNPKYMQPGLQLKYFVLKPSGRNNYNRASRIAMLAYAEAIREENPVLAAELETWSVNEENAANEPVVTKS